MKRQGFIIVCVIIVITIIFMLIDTKLFDDKKDMYTYIKNALLCGFLSGCTYYFSIRQCNKNANLSKDNIKKLNNAPIAFNENTNGLNFLANRTVLQSKNLKHEIDDTTELHQGPTQTTMPVHVFNKIPPGEIILTGDPTI